MTPEERLADWARESPRFRGFADAHAAKIRKKLRIASDAESRRDVQVELDVARSLLADRRFEVAYEAYGVGRLGPDFTVTFRGGERFNVEVTRLRGAATPDAIGRVMLAKLRQLPKESANVLVVIADDQGPDASTLDAVARSLRQRADRRDETVLVGAGVRDSRAFYGRFLRLSAVIVWAESGAGDRRAEPWTNPSARHHVSPPALRACLGCLVAAETR